MAQRDGELTGQYLDQSVETANRLIQILSTTISDFRNFFSPDKEIVSFSALEQIHYAVDLVETAFKNNGITISVEIANDYKLFGFPNEYSLALLNLLTNARDAIMESGSTPGLITITITDRDGKGIVTIRDNGGGISDAILDKIFEPYFSTKKMGTGIGLYVSKMIIERNMNCVIMAKIVDGGAEFSVHIPLAEGKS